MKKAVFWDVAPTTRCHIPEDCFLHSHRRENLKSYIVAEMYSRVPSAAIGMDHGEKTMLLYMGCCVVMAGCCDSTFIVLSEYGNCSILKAARPK
jgi:hypothetical protein